ncbi:glycosyltransferase family 2 protein [Bacteroides hominis]|uniref:glycosyltransferase family 2 protein n=1 Tax=Bacteroides hominis TaxID=2763023 RepID=UPI003D6B62BF
MIKISVILPVYNAQKTIVESINSILQQTYSDFELIVIDDGSTDDSKRIIKNYNDKRIIFIENTRNRGLIYTLNRGLMLARGKYIARMDADDISLPTRLEKQLKVMEANPNIIVCGTQIKKIGIRKKRLSIIPNEIYKRDSISNKNRLAFDPCFAHPSTMIRKEILINNNILYNENYIYAEDYKLWIDLLMYGDFYNIQEKLLLYRISDTQITNGGNMKQDASAKLCRREFIARYVNKEIAEDMLTGNITVSTIRKIVKTKPRNLYLLRLCFLSLRKYDFQSLMYYSFSFCWLHWGLYYNLCILKRFIMGRKSLL